MFKIIKNFNWIITLSFLCILLGILTFLTFFNQGFIPLSGQNLQILLTVDIILLLIFFTLIFKNAHRLYIAGKRNKAGTQTNLKYISLFTLFTFIPSLLIAIFSLFIFNFGVQNFLNKNITQAVNSSYDVAKNYLEDSKKTILTDTLLIGFKLNRAADLFYLDKKSFAALIWSEKILRRVDDIYLIDSSGNIIYSDDKISSINFLIPSKEEYMQATEGMPIIVINNSENKTSSMVKLNNIIDTYLYVSRNIDENILRYLNETKKAVNFYYIVENKQLGLKITFAVIYVIIVTLLLFLSAVIAITYANRLTKPIINLISASKDISQGELNVKVPDIETDEEFKMLNKNFNNMIDRLKKQQDKLLITERYSAWESVARKLAHEIKNPLTPIQLSIDRLQEKYTAKISEGQEDFKNYLETINRQIKDIENLANEFSNFARMPSPIMKQINIFLTVKRAVDFIKMSSKNNISLKSFNDEIFIKGDSDQLYRVFINLIKNSEEAFIEKKLKKADFIGKIDIEIIENSDYILIKLRDNGLSILDTKKVMTPYFTTKKNGTGLGLPIVSKIINEHSGELTISNIDNNKGVEVLISLQK